MKNCKVYKANIKSLNQHSRHTPSFRISNNKDHVAHRGVWFLPTHTHEALEISVHLAKHFLKREFPEKDIGHNFIFCLQKGLLVMFC